MDAIKRALGEHYIVISHDIESDEIYGVFSTFEQAAYYLAHHVGWWWSCDIEWWCGSDHETVLYSYQIGNKAK